MCFFAAIALFVLLTIQVCLDSWSKAQFLTVRHADSPDKMHYYDVIRSVSGRSYYVVLNNTGKPERLILKNSVAISDHGNVFKEIKWTKNDELVIWYLDYMPLDFQLGRWQSIRIKYVHLAN